VQKVRYGAATKDSCNLSILTDLEKKKKMRSLFRTVNEGMGFAMQTHARYTLGVSKQLAA